MEIYICENIFVPLRSAPSHKSEMLSQVLFGEKYCIIDKSGSWIKIETLFDKQGGWLDTDHLQHTIDDKDTKGEVLNSSLPCYNKNDKQMVLEAGCEIYNPDFENNLFTAGNDVFKTGPEFNRNFLSSNGSVSDTAMKFINSPYLWGGRVPSGLDCSGFTQLVYKIHGVAIPRNSSEQSERGKSIDFIDETEAGDLVFFDNERGKITHVGMILSKGRVIHASGIVRIDSIDHQGIFKQEIGRYSHHLRTIKRMT